MAVHIDWHVLKVEPRDGVDTKKQPLKPEDFSGCWVVEVWFNFATLGLRGGRCRAVWTRAII